ncbi:MAG: gliding motility-associated C-terminal domain-containing protein, partial [Bacteroidia bacterium]|nr:gliding motility-associated C-terminal domain-containing protein [Bacteroidia bacterium]
NVACVEVDQPSVAGTVSGGGNFCASAGPATLTVTGNNGTAVGWYSSPNAITWTSTSNTTTTQNFGVTTTDTWYRFCTKNGVCPMACDSQLINIDPTSDAGTLTAPFSVCSTGNSGNINTTGTVGTITSWGSSINAGVTWTPIVNATSTEAYLNLTATTDYFVIAQSGVCPPDTSFTTVTVDVPGVGGTVSGGALFCGTTGSGTLTLSGSTGTIAGWQYSTNGGVTWTPIANTTTTNIYSGVSQTTLYQAIIGTGGCPVVYSVADTVFYMPSPNAGVLNVDTTVCAGFNSGILSLTGSSGSSFIWFISTNSGATWINIGNNSTTYTFNNILVQTQFLVVANSGICGTDTSNVITVDIIPVVPVNAGPSGTINQGATFQITATGGVGTINWFPPATLSSSSIFNPVATPSVTTSYTITVQDANGCFAADSVTVYVNQSAFTGVVANSLTPNGDGINDAWYVENALSYIDTDVKIFNEYGMEIFSAAPYKNDWKGTYNGSKLPDGTYFYVLKFTKTDQTLKGTINLISQ